MAMKPRVLYLMQYLEQHSDEQHPVSTAEIRRELAAKGCPVTIQTLRMDIESLIEAGYEIDVNEKEGFSTTYSWINRDLSTPELQILVDAVSASQFIPAEKSRDLIGKLVALAGPSSRAGLTPRILVSERIKAPNKQILINVQAIRRAIDENRKITFKYLRYNMNKQQEMKHAGTPEEDYSVSPYATVYSDNRYYLVGYSDKRKEMNTFRVDRMTKVKQSKKKRVPEPEDFNVQDYTDRVFWMYDGREEQVTLRCRQNLMDQVIDKFGEGVDVRNVRNDTFDITVPVDISGTFYAWVTQFVGEMAILAPGHIRDMYVEYLQKAIDDTLAVNG